MVSAASSSCPSDFRLDQRDAGELPAPLAAGLEAHLSSCSSCQARLAARAEEAARFVVDLTLVRALGTPPGHDVRGPAADAAAPAVTPRVMGENMPAPGPSRAAPVAVFLRRMAAPVMGGAVAAGLALAVVGPREKSEDLRPVVETRAKGATRAELFVQDTAGVRAVSDGAVVHPGDTLQVTVTSATDVFVAVLSIDGAHHVSTYVPTDGDMVRVERGTRIPLPQSTILDDVLGAETVAVFVCANTLADPTVLQGRIIDGEPPAGCQVQRFHLEKRSP